MSRERDHGDVVERDVVLLHSLVPHPQGHGVGPGPRDDPHKVGSCILVHGEGEPQVEDDLPVVNVIELLFIWLPSGVQISVVHFWFGLLSR